MDDLWAIKEFATLHHVTKKGQMYGPLPYTHHCETVERILREFGETRSVMLQAAWGHDLIEDTDVKRRDLAERFGQEVADLVWAVTSEPGENRKIRNALTYPKIRAYGPDAVKLKLADRLANVRPAGGSIDMYVKEYPDFRHNLFDAVQYYESDSICRMWDELDSRMNYSKRSPRGPL